MTTAEPAALPFGAGAILRSTFAGYFRRFHLFFLLALPPTLLVQVGAEETFVVLTDLAMSWLGGAGPESNASTFELAVYTKVRSLAGVFVFWLSGAFTILLALDASARQPARIRTYFLVGLRRLMPIAPLVLVVAVFMTIFAWVGDVVSGAGADSMPSGPIGHAVAAVFLVAGLWVGAVFSTSLPVAVLEGLGLPALARSIRLTKGYRWPIAGVLAVVAISAFILAMLVHTAISTLSIPLLPYLYAPEELLTAWLLITTGPVVISIGLTLAVGLMHAALAQIYARLRYIEDGTTPAALVSMNDPVASSITAR